MVRLVPVLLIWSGSLTAVGQEPKGSPVPAPAAPPAAAAGSPTALEDHRQMMGALGIKTLRPGASVRERSGPTAVNYDEARVRAFSLPDPLVCRDGTPVPTAELWWNRRRPEIVEDFEREVLGRVPPNLPAVRWEVTGATDEDVGGHRAKVRTLVGRVDNAACPTIEVALQLTLATPADASGPVPVILEFGFGPRPGGPAGKAATPRVAGPVGPSWQAQTLAQGWGYAILVPTSIQADSGAGLTRGIIGLGNRGQPRKPDDWGALRAWAWGASRALDYLETDPTVDARRVAIEGLSRYGKAALVAMAFDSRFAVGFIGSSGEGGAKLHRRNFGELVENLTAVGEYHWMAGNFLKYGGPLTPDDLPVDAHELIALCAPRPTFISYGAATGPGAEGQWLDQRGSFLAAVAAGPVFRLLGQRDLRTAEYPLVEAGLLDGELAWRQHKGGHTNGPNWPTFLSFAGRYFRGKMVPMPGKD